MKYLRALLLSALILPPTISVADNVFFVVGNPTSPNSILVPALINSGSATISANPDPRRVAGSALIMKSDNLIDDATIPSNAIPKTYYFTTVLIPVDTAIVPVPLNNTIELVPRPSTLILKYQPLVTNEQVIK